MHTATTQSPTQTLADLIGATVDSGARLRVVIVTPDLLGPVKNGGIGTACTYLAYALAGYGHEVHILFSQSDATESKDSWKRDYTDRGIEVTLASEWDKARGQIPCFPDHAPLYMAHVVHEWLAAQKDIDIVIFMEWSGHGFYALHAKQCGLRFQDTVMAVIVHSPSLWHCINNAETQCNPIESCTWHMERSCIEMADAVISPSSYMLDWCREHGYRLPRHTFVQHNLLEWDTAISHTSNKPIEEVVFFGRLEYRKGLEQFCAALDIMVKHNQLPKFVTFLGKCSWMGNEHAVLYIARRAKAWNGCTISLKLHCDHRQAVSYLCGKGRLAVIPSVADNLPYSVYECLVAGIPFMARHVGGIPELIDPKQHQDVLFGDNPHELAQKIANALDQAPVRAQLSFDRHENTQSWCAGLHALLNMLRADKRTQAVTSITEPPFISVCLTHYNRPHLLRQAIDSLLGQTYPHFEVILADDGSTDAEVIEVLDAFEPLFTNRGWKILRLQNGYLGKARNTAVREAKGKYFLFMDDDNVAKQDMLQRFSQAAVYGNADLVVSSFDVFSGNTTPDECTPIREQFLPAGGAVAYATTTNIIGDSNSLIRREMFETLHGFTEDYGLGHEDFELYLRVVLSNGQVSIIPDTTFWYRRNNTSMLSSTNLAANRMRSLRPFIEMWHAPLGELALMAHRMAHSINAESTQTTVDIDFNADPQSDSFLIQIAESLSQNGQQYMAQEILTSLHTATLAPSVRAHFLCIRAQHAVVAKDFLELNKCIKTFNKAFPYKKDVSTAHDRRAFYEMLLHSVPANKDTKNIYKIIFDVLKREGDGSIETDLGIVKSALAINKVDDAIFSFFKALAMAEHRYLESRPDVLEAVKDSRFICALQHYALHGRVDRMEWPNKHLFAEILQNYPQFFPALCTAHMSSYTYTDADVSQEIIQSLQRNI